MKTNLRMRSARAAKGWTQQDLADVIGATRQTIGLIEKEMYNPSLKLCLSIARALDKTLDDLFWKKDNS